MLKFVRLIEKVLFSFHFEAHFNLFQPLSVESNSNSPHAVLWKKILGYVGVKDLIQNPTVCIKQNIKTLPQIKSFMCRFLFLN